MPTIGEPSHGTQRAAGDAAGRDQPLGHATLRRCRLVRPKHTVVRAPSESSAVSTRPCSPRPARACWWRGRDRVCGLPARVPSPHAYANGPVAWWRSSRTGGRRRGIGPGADERVSRPGQSPKGARWSRWRRGGRAVLPCPGLRGVRRLLPQGARGPRAKTAARCTLNETKAGDPMCAG